MRRLLVSWVKSVSPRFHRYIQLVKYENQRLPKMFVKHLRSLTDRDLVIDVGANVGMVSECMAKRKAKIISIEPNKKALIKLNKVAARHKNITVMDVAAGTSNRTVKLYMHKDSLNTEKDYTQASSLLSDKSNVTTEIYEEIREIDFAEYLLSIDRQIELIKIDIEGYEIELINHLLDRNALNKVKKIYIETHENKIESLKDPTSKLKCRIIEMGMKDKFFYDWH